MIARDAGRHPVVKPLKIPSRFDEQFLERQFFTGAQQIILQIQHDGYPAAGQAELAAEPVAGGERQQMVDAVRRGQMQEIVYREGIRCGRHAVVRAVGVFADILRRFDRATVLGEHVEALAVESAAGTVHAAEGDFSHTQILAAFIFQQIVPAAAAAGGMEGIGRLCRCLRLVYDGRFHENASSFRTSEVSCFGR